MGMETSGRRRLLLILKLIISTDKLKFCRGLFNRVKLGALCLEALAVDDGGAALVVLLLGDPHLPEGGEGSQDGASDPDGVLPLGGSDDLDLDGGATSTCRIANNGNYLEKKNKLHFRAIFVTFPVPVVFTKITFFILPKLYSFGIDK